MASGQLSGIGPVTTRNILEKFWKRPWPTRWAPKWRQHSRAATYRAQAEADSTARRDLADKASALDASLAEGVGVVAELGGALKQRDAEAAALCDQVNIERRLHADAGDQACSSK